MPSTTDSITGAPDEEIITQLTLAGLKVLMVRKRDQIIYKLPDNMSVSSIGEEQRKLLLSEIQALHAATMAAAAKANTTNKIGSEAKTIAPKQNGFAAPLPSASTAEADALKETARKLREELEQQQLKSQHDGNYVLQSMPEIKTTRKYVKTGKYSKKRLQQQQVQQQSLSQQQLLALQQSLQAASTLSVPSSPAQPNPLKPLAFPASQLPSLPILTKRLPEEEAHQLEVKRRFIESLDADKQAVTRPNYFTPFQSTQDAINRLLPYHIYQYPKGDLDANKIPLDRQDNAMLDLFKCQTEMFAKHAAVSKALSKNANSTSLQISLEKQLLAEQRQRLTEEQTRVAAEQAAQHQEMLRLQAEQARQAADAQGAPVSSQPMQATSYANGLAQANAILQNPQFASQYSQLSPDLQQQLLRNREQLKALIEQHSKDNNTFAR
ncbi:hypothetical protein EC973_003851 [Apophysomyces ossiformis]|uniref:GLTSCR protein conserved domain-containing protein n=1 Tax=Apophysomyces ossiformis TaxID=679940 RepID=A0A8H7BXV8_9FUNG|nr:hypothetical protein EC973_003851 [Apophysomyces ossiformis]